MPEGYPRTNWARAVIAQPPSVHWSRKLRDRAQGPIAELLAFGLELLADQPDDVPLRQLIKMNAADLVVVAQNGGRPQSSIPGHVSASTGSEGGISRDSVLCNRSIW
jgi:hypothetical protein